MVKWGTIVAVSPARVRKVLKLVDELELDSIELRALRSELDARSECEIDLAACKDEDDRQLAVTIKRRIDAHARGELELVSMADVMKTGREELRRIQDQRKRTTSR